MITKIFLILSTLARFINFAVTQEEKRAESDGLARVSDLDQAYADLEKATTKEEIVDAQKRIARLRADT